MSLALLTGVFWDDFLTLRQKTTGRKMKISYYLLLAIAVIGAIGAAVYVSYHYLVMLKGVIVASAFLIFGLGLSFVAFINKRYVATFLFIAYSVAIFLLPFAILVVPEIERYETSKEVSGRLLGLMKPGELLGSQSNYLAGLAFYTGKFPTDLDKHHIMVDFLGADQRVWCVIKEKNHRQLYELDQKVIYSKPSYLMYRMGKRAIVTNKLPDGRFILKRGR
jgi:hypothetical protein